MLPVSDLTFNELTVWYLDLPKVNEKRSYNSMTSSMKAFNSEFGNYIVNNILPEDLERYQQKHLKRGKKPRTIDKEIAQAQTIVEKGFYNKKVDGDALRAFKSDKNFL